MSTSDSWSQVRACRPVAPLPEPSDSGWRSSNPDFPGMVQ